MWISIQLAENTIQRTEFLFSRLDKKPIFLIMKIELQAVLKRELKQRRFSVNAVARQCNMPVSVLHSWVQGVLPSAKNLHYIAALSKCLDLPVAVLLFDQIDHTSDSTVLFNSEFTDGGHRYRLSIEKIGGG